MSGSHHRENDFISPYSVGNGPGDPDDETYLQMDQFQGRDSASGISNIRSHLNSVLTLHNSDTSPSLPIHQYRPPSGYSDWSPTTGDPSKNLPKPAARSTTPNYTQWDPTRKANRFTTSGLPGNPPIHPRLPPRLSEGPTVIDDQEDYLTFDSSGPERSQVFHPGQPARRPPAPFPVEDPPPRPPRSPAKRSPYDDHRPPLRPPQKYETDQPPERPPPPPPTQMSSTNLPQYPSSNNLPPYKERRGSDKSSSSHSPASSRPSSIKDQTIPFSHIPDRRNNYSTESSGSTSSEDLAKVSRPKSSTATSSKFVPKKQDKLVQNQFTKALSTHRQSLPFTSAMPGFESPPSPGRQDEEQSLLKDLSHALETKFTHANPYLMCQSSFLDPAASLQTDISSSDMVEKTPIIHNNPPTRGTGYSAGTPTSGTEPFRPLPKNTLHPPPPSVPPKSIAVARQQLNNATRNNPIIEDGCERMDKPVPKLEPATTVEEQSYFKDMGRVDAQSLISSIKQDGVFIVRPRPESATKPYALTLWANNKFYNFLIRKRSDDKYALGNEKEDERSFHTVHSLIEFHQQNDLVLAEKEGSVKLTISPSFS